MAPVLKGRLLSREDIAQDVVDGDAHWADQNLTLRHATIASASVVMIRVAPAAVGKLGCRGRRCHRKRPEQPSCNKNNTSNFGPHRSMFLSIDVNRIQHLTTIDTNEQ